LAETKFSPVNLQLLGALFSAVRLEQIYKQSTSSRLSRLVFPACLKKTNCQFDLRESIY